MKKLLSVIVSLSMIISLLSFPMSAHAAITASQPDGNGTADSPYIITNAGELYWFSDLVNGSLSDTKQNVNAYATLANDIVVNTNVIRTDGTLIGTGSSFEVWTPIGSSSSSSYKGVFDGAGHSVRGLYYSGSEVMGLFGYNDGTIRDVGVIKSYLNTSGEYIGGVCAYNTGNVKNSYNTSTIYNSNSTGYEGGVCGYSTKMLNDCYNSGDITCTTYSGGYFGGIVGYGYAQNCYNTGNVTGKTYRSSNSYIGGICGYSSGNTKYCYNAGNISGTGYSSSSYIVYAYIGGISGYYGTNEYCYNSGTVKGEDSYTYAGGISGYNTTVVSCYNLGSVSGYTGKVGQLIGLSGNIQYSYYLDDKDTLTASGGSSTTSTGCESKTTKQFKSGEVAYLLNGGYSAGTEWYQDIGTDSGPVFYSTHGLVYYGYLHGESEKIYTNTPTHDTADSHDSYDDGNGFCSICGYDMAHTYSNGICTRCNEAHEDHIYSKGICTVCQAAHSDHKFSNSVCSICGYVCENHTYSNGICTICSYAHEAHAYVLGTCTICGLRHTDHEYANSTCTICGYICADHTYANGTCSICGNIHEDHSYKSGVCTVCGYTHPGHIYTKGVCSICGYTHVDHTYVNGVCIVCDVEHISHIYNNGICTVCGYEHADHVYENGVCTVCHKAHEDHTYSDAVCTVCGLVHYNHSYENGNCTVCGFEHTNHIYKDGICAVCGLECEHSFVDSICEICKQGCTHEYIGGICINCNAYESTVSLSAGKTVGHKGETVSVPIVVSGNSGIAGVKLLLYYDSSVLTPVSVNTGDDFAAGIITSNIQQDSASDQLEYISAYWENTSDIASDTELMKVTFTINDDAKIGQTSLELKCQGGDVTNQNYDEIGINLENGYISIKDILPGDVYEDDVVNAKDGVRLGQFLAKWNIELSWAEERAADVVKDGVINTKDGILLSQYLADWDVSLSSAELSSDGNIAFMVGKVSAKAGEYVDVPVMITSNSGVAGFNLKMNYDNSILEPVSVKQGSALDTGAIVSNLQQENASVDNVTVYWSNPANLTNVGEAFTVRFKVSEKASGNYPITLSYEENDLPSTQDLSELETTITDGGLIVTDEILCNINSLFTSYTEDKFSAYVNYTNYSDKDAKLILAFYGDDGSMTDVITTPIQQAAALTTVISTDKINSTSQVKAFIWNSENGMVPLCESLSYN